jgi:hypothetical protein
LKDGNVDRFAGMDKVSDIVAACFFVDKVVILPPFVSKY